MRIYIHQVSLAIYVCLSGIWLGGLFYLSFLSYFFKLVCYAHVFPCNIDRCFYKYNYITNVYTFTINGSHCIALYLCQTAASSYLTSSLTGTLLVATALESWWVEDGIRKIEVRGHCTIPPSYHYFLPAIQASCREKCMIILIPIM